MPTIQQLIKSARQKLTKKQKLKMIKRFVTGATARTIAEIVGVNKNIA